MDVEDAEREEMERAFEEISQSQSSQRTSASQRSSAAPPIIPQSHVGNRRNRRAAASSDDAPIAAEPGFANAPVDISKKKKELLEALRKVKTSKTKDSVLSKKECFKKCFLDEIDKVAEYLELPETGELIHYSAVVYGLRVDATYNDAMSTNCQLQPGRTASQHDSKKSKTEQKQQLSDATQQLNLQKLQGEIQQDEPEEESSATSEQTPETEHHEMGGEETDGGGGGGADEMGGGHGMGSDDEEGDARVSVERSEGHKEKESDSRQTDTTGITYTNTVISDLVKAEYERRQRNLDRKCDLNPMLMDDEKKYRMGQGSIMNNEYYQIATAHCQDQNAAALLSYNAKVTHNGRMILMHKRMDTWKDHEAHDLTEPTRAFRGAISGLVDNAMRKKPMDLPNSLFDPADCVTKGLKMLTEQELQEIERKMTEKIMNRTDDFNFLDNDDEVEESEPTLSRPPSHPGAEQVGEGGVTNGVTNGGGEPSLDPSTPAAETEASSTSAGTTPKGGDKDANKEEGQGEKEEDLLVQAVTLKKKRFRNAIDLKKVMGPDEIPNGPVLTVTDLASKFQQILFNKIAMGSKIEWKKGANSEELQANAKEIHEDCFCMEAAGVDDELRELDFIWNAVLYKKTITREESMKMRAEREKEDREHILQWGRPLNRIVLEPGDYEFIGEPDNFRNPDIPPDETAGIVTGDQPLVRQLFDENETQKFEKILENPDDDESNSNETVGDERIHIEPEADGMNYDIGPMNDDDGFGGGFSDDDDIRSGSNGGQIASAEDGTDGGVDKRLADDLLPSAAVRQTGKADDSHWKGNPEVVKVKKERKKKTKDENEMKPKTFFNITEDMSDNKKITNRFRTVEKNVMLMKETDQLLMPVQVNVVPQTDYDCSQFFKPFFLPNVLHDKYRYRQKEIVEKDENEDDLMEIDVDGRLAHYARMLDTSIGRRADEDAYLSFMKQFKDYPDVATQKEMDIEERVRTGEIEPEEAAMELNDHVDMGGFDDDDGGMGGEMNGVLDDDEANFSHRPSMERARESRARSQANASTHGYSMRLDRPDMEDDSDAVATVGDREYHLRLIKLDTVAMKTALSDVLTNPMMVPEKLDETLAHFHRVIPSQKNAYASVVSRGKKGKTPLQPISEDGALDMSERRDVYELEEEEEPAVDIEATMMEMPDALNVTRALFAPPKEKVKSIRTVAFGTKPSSSQAHNHMHDMSQEHIELKGHHTLKSTFTCLPARLPQRSSSDVTVASTIAMILHLANENNLILNQDGQQDELDDDADNGAYANWMTDFDVHCVDDDAEGTKMAKMKKRISDGVGILYELSADEKMEDAQKRQKETEKLLANVAAKQREEAKEAEKKKEGEKREKEKKEREVERKKEEEEEREKKRQEERERRRDQPGPSTARHDEDSDDDIIDITADKSPAFKIPSTPSTSSRKMLRKADEDSSGPSTKRSRPTRPAEVTIDDEEEWDETIVLD